MSVCLFKCFPEADRVAAVKNKAVVCETARSQRLFQYKTVLQWSCVEEVEQVYTSFGFILS